MLAMRNVILKGVFMDKPLLSLTVLLCFFLCISVPPVPTLENQSDIEVGGCVERTGLSGSYSILRCPGGEWSLSQVLTLGTVF